MKLEYETGGSSNFRYVTAVMIEARMRGYPLLETTPQELVQAEGFSEYINKIIDWLVAEYPEEFSV